MSTKITLVMVVLGLAIISTTFSASLQPAQKVKGSTGLVGLLTLVKNQHEAMIKADPEYNLIKTSWDQFWERVRQYADAKNLNGLVGYLKVLPETLKVLEWLKVKFPQVWGALCPLFDACYDDVHIPPEVIQKILQLIYRNDWDGLVDYLETLEEFDALCEWIKANFEDAWAEICVVLGKPC